VTQCHSLVLMTGTKVPLWDLGSVSLCGIIAGIWAVIALDGHSCLFTPAIWSGCWFFAASQPSAFSIPTMRSPSCSFIRSFIAAHAGFVVLVRSACGSASISSDQSAQGRSPCQFNWSCRQRSTSLNRFFLLMNRHRADPFFKCKCKCKTLPSGVQQGC